MQIRGQDSTDRERLEAGKSGVQDGRSERGPDGRRERVTSGAQSAELMEDAKLFFGNRSAPGLRWQFVRERNECQGARKLDSQRRVPGPSTCSLPRRRALFRSPQLSSLQSDSLELVRQRFTNSMTDNLLDCLTRYLREVEIARKRKEEDLKRREGDRKSRTPSGSA
jgi:hypothetical protein